MHIANTMPIEYNTMVHSMHIARPIPKHGVNKWIHYAKHVPNKEEQSMTTMSCEG